ncbi:hypothetical protein L1987_40160 [Smallanthus sonchifolius]|uniref:Uncharacterized protein n=1 Tax=Smallanthus sonchifolius TaxID=185202 RepID=A0ACB9GTG7_9ASTR|nr:hypothetical protein L1987_40160 [Smallanthus sonchifolius]
MQCQIFLNIFSNPHFFFTNPSSQTPLCQIHLPSSSRTHLPKPFFFTTVKSGQQHAVVGPPSLPNASLRLPCVAVQGSGAQPFHSRPQRLPPSTMCSGSRKQKRVKMEGEGQEKEGVGGVGTSSGSFKEQNKVADACVNVTKVLDRLLRVALDPSSFMEKEKNLPTVTQLVSFFWSSVFKSGLVLKFL